MTSSDEIKKFTAIAFGEVLWDVYPQHKTLGGAPFNVLGHLQQLGFSTQIVSRIGDDALGHEITQQIRKVHVGSALLQVDAQNPTGTVQVSLDSLGKPSYEISSPVAWDFIEVNPSILDAVASADLFIFGSLAGRNALSRKSLFQLLDASPRKVLDLNLRLDFYTRSLIEALLYQADILKVNDDEFKLLGELFELGEGDLYTHLVDVFDLEIIVQTRGADGAEAFDRHRVSSCVGHPVTVVDTVGSGDAFLAGFLSKYVAEVSLSEALNFGCRLGAYVATQEGAIPRHPHTWQTPWRH